MILFYLDKTDANIVSSCDFPEQLTDDSSLLNIRRDSRKSSLISPSLLMHDLTASLEFEKTSPRSILPNINNKINPYDKFRNQYSSKLELPRQISDKSAHMSLKQYAERMNLDIKVAIARSARNFQTFTRRKSRIY